MVMLNYHFGGRVSEKDFSLDVRYGGKDCRDRSGI